LRRLILRKTDAGVLDKVKWLFWCCGWGGGASVSLVKMAFVGIRGGVLRSRRVSVRCCAGGVGKKSVLVVGATGKLGRLVVEELLQRKMSVIGLARDRDRAKEVGLGEDLEGLDMRFGTFADGSAVEAVEAVKEDVGAVIWAAGPSRTSPSAIVDNQAVNEVAGKFKDLLAGQNDYLFDFENSPSAQSFRPVDDVVMGGVSRSIIESTSEGNEQYARFQGIQITARDNCIVLCD